MVGRNRGARGAILPWWSGKSLLRRLRVSWAVMMQRSQRLRPWGRASQAEGVEHAKLRRNDLIGRGRETSVPSKWAREKMWWSQRDRQDYRRQLGPYPTCHGNPLESFKQRCDIIWLCLTSISLLWRVTCGKEGGSKKTSQGCPRESSERAARVMRSGWILDACWRWSLFDLLIGCEGIKQTVTQDDSWISAWSNLVNCSAVSWDGKDNRRTGFGEVESSLSACYV